MNSVTKLIYITMVITYWQFPLVQTGPKLGELLNKKDPTYLSLELTADSRRALFHYRQDQDHENELSDPNLKFLYFCPPQLDWHAAVIKKTKRSFLFLVQISSERKTVWCENPVLPSLTQNNEKQCGEQSRGIEHSLYYEIYYPTAFFTIMTWGTMDIQELEKLAKNSSYSVEKYLTVIILYRFCFYHNTRQTAFVSYIVNSPSSKQSQIPQNFDTRLTENDQPLFGLDNAPLCYEKKNQSLGYDFDDYLVEQMLVPWDDIAEDLERGTTKNYVNISPQWNSLREDWNSLNQYFKSYSIQRVMCGTYGKFEYIQLGKTQVDEDDEEQQQEMPPDQLHDSNTFKKSNLTMTAPLYWWKLITFSEDKGIVVIMPNYPKNVRLPSDTFKPLCEDVCDTYGWTDVKTINATITCCRPKAELIAKLLSSNPADIPKYASWLAIAKNSDVKVCKKRWDKFTNLWFNTD